MYAPALQRASKQPSVGHARRLDVLVRFARVHPAGPRHAGCGGRYVSSWSATRASRTTWFAARGVPSCASSPTVATTCCCPRRP
eukprot:1984913-Lingulodinium_polyedra.AAC.1